MEAPSPLFALALAALLVAPGLRRPAARAWVVAFLATLVLFIALRALPSVLPIEHLLGVPWHWSGPLLGLAGVLGVALMLARRAGLGWPEMGFTLRQRPGAWRAALAVSALALVINGLAMRQSAFRLPGVPLETWLHQATLPGLVEEAVFRGVLLALLDPAFRCRVRLFGAPFGWGGVVVTLVFLALHGVTLGTLLGVLPAALLYLWLRVHTGSLLAPVIVHNLWNLSVFAAHL